jgi:hypothetical protein
VERIIAELSNIQSGYKLRRYIWQSVRLGERSKRNEHLIMTLNQVTDVLLAFSYKKKAKANMCPVPELDSKNNEIDIVMCC